MIKYPLKIPLDMNPQPLISELFEKARDLGFYPTVLIVKDSENSTTLYPGKEMEPAHVAEINRILEAHGVPAI